MPNDATERRGAAARPRRQSSYEPSENIRALLPETSGNALNGLGETVFRRASPTFWHPPDQHPFGAAAQFAAARVRATPDARDAFAQANDYPDLQPISPRRPEQSPEAWTTEARAFALSNEADLFGATVMQEAYLVEGYEIAEPNILILGFAHDYENLQRLPSTLEDDAGVTEVGRQYARGTRASFALANWIRARGYSAQAFPGPRAGALLLIPAAIDAGLGELGKHGSMINRTHGSNFRLAAVTTDMPIVSNEADTFGADDFCRNCRICADACPPDAIIEDKQWVRGSKRWYVDFDKCVPYFAENAACGICIAVCPWSRPGVADNLLVKMARRQAARGHRSSAE